MRYACPLGNLSVARAHHDNLRQSMPASADSGIGVMVLQKNQRFRAIGDSDRMRSFADAACEDVRSSGHEEPDLPYALDPIDAKIHINCSNSGDSKMFRL